MHLEIRKSHYAIGTKGKHTHRFIFYDWAALVAGRDTCWKRHVALALPLFEIG